MCSDIIIISQGVGQEFFVIRKMRGRKCNVFPAFLYGLEQAENIAEQSSM